MRKVELNAVPGSQEGGDRSLPVLDPCLPALAQAGVHDPKDLGPTHFIGIGGAGMSVLAEMLHQEGVQVSGSDRAEGDKTRRLRQLGIRVAIGQDARNIAGARTVVWSSAIKPDNPEILAARDAGARLVHRSDILDLLMASRISVTVAGAHGKTTTSALLAHLLTKGGSGDLADPSYAIGGSLQSGQGPMDGGHVGAGRVLVAEADESDGSFGKYTPDIAIITNVEPDHLDHYGTADAFHQAFVEHARQARRFLVVCGDDRGALEVLRRLHGDCRAGIIIYASDPRLSAESLPGVLGLVRIESESESSGSGREHCRLALPAQVLQATGLETSKPLDLQVDLAIPGIHNARNAAAAIIAAILLGMEPDTAAACAADFRGASRRFEVRGCQHEVTVVDDYAHHPTEIAALLTAARRRYPGRTIRVLFQPHLYSRTAIFADRFADALSLADDVTVTDIFPARELASDYPGVDAGTIPSAARKIAAAGPLVGRDSDQKPQDSGNRSNGTVFRSCPNMRQAALDLAERAEPGDVILTVGAGDVTAMGPVILDRLAERDQQ
ncbi:UDP-N-acetylmuramate--L-alanine ligase [Bifidobacterium asteroides]|uniref:UDP-N-acetylmuramate--L-alanine ligase n=1 Tax=Bifidobacterium asteroides TaxID=1684 RepID=A0A318M3C6_9BIFI|nr:UDP-N-acetylmuramate--L-alanine ligase [Bifidobacterium asteroides]